MATGRELNWQNKTNAVNSTFGPNEKLTGGEINDLRDKHNAVDNALKNVEDVIPGMNQNTSDAQQQADQNATDIEANVDSIQELQNQSGNHTVNKNVPSNAVFTDTLPHAQATNQGNTFNQSNKLLQLDSDSMVPSNLLKGTISCYKKTGSVPVNGTTLIDHYAPFIESSFVTLNAGVFFTMAKGHYILDFSFDYGIPEIFTVKLSKNGTVSESNRCSHNTTFPIYVSLPSDKYTIEVECSVQVSIDNIQVKIIRS